MNLNKNDIEYLIQSIDINVRQNGLVSASVGVGVAVKLQHMARELDKPPVDVPTPDVPEGEE